MIIIKKKKKKNTWTKKTTQKLFMQATFAVSVGSQSLYYFWSAAGLTQRLITKFLKHVAFEVSTSASAKKSGETWVENAGELFMEIATRR